MPTLRKADLLDPIVEFVTHGDDHRWAVCLAAIDLYATTIAQEALLGKPNHLRRWLASAPSEAMTRCRTMGHLPEPEEQRLLRVLKAIAAKGITADDDATFAALSTCALVSGRDSQVRLLAGFVDALHPSPEALHLTAINFIGYNAGLLPVLLGAGLNPNSGDGDLLRHCIRSQRALDGGSSPRLAMPILLAAGASPLLALRKLEVCPEFIAGLRAELAGQSGVDNY